MSQTCHNVAFSLNLLPQAFYETASSFSRRVCFSFALILGRQSAAAAHFYTMFTSLHVPFISLLHFHAPSCEMDMYLGGQLWLAGRFGREGSGSIPMCEKHLWTCATTARASFSCMYVRILLGLVREGHESARFTIYLVRLG